MFFLMRLQPKQEDVLVCPDSRILYIERFWPILRTSSLLKLDRAGKRESSEEEQVVEPELAGAIL
jgi:hypothetical protein